jgi:hypothetical protein
MYLIKEVDFQPLDKVVITFDKFRTYVTDFTVTEPTDEKVVEDGKEVDAVAKTKVVKNKVRYNQQVARVLAVPSSERDLKVGDEILVDFRGCFKLDGYKEIYIIPKYNMIGVMAKPAMKESYPLKLVKGIE